MKVLKTACTALVILTISSGTSLAAPLGNDPVANATEAATTSPAAQEQAAIRALMQRYQQAMRDADIDGIAATMHNDVITTFQDKPTLRGKEAVLQSYRATFAAMDFAGIEYLIDDLQVAGDLAVVSTSHPAGAFVTVKARQNRIPDRNRELFVLKKENNQWRIYRYMYNQTAAVAH